MSMDENVLFSIIADPAGVEEGVAAASGSMEELGGVAETIGGVFDAMSAQIEAAVSGVAATMADFSASMSGTMSAMSDMAAQASAAGGSLGALSGTAGETAGALDALGTSGSAAASGLGDTAAAADAATPALAANRDAALGMGEGFGALGMPLAATALGIGAVGAGALVMASQYQSSMSVVQALTGQTAQQMQQFNGQVLSMSGQLGVPAKQLSDGLYYVLSAGVQAKDAMGVLKTVTEASAAGMVNASTDADALTSALNAYGQGANQAQNYQDMLLVALRDGKTTMQELASSVGRAAVTGNAAGFSFNQVAAAMSTMTLSGDSARIASTQLAFLMRDLGVNTSVVEKNAAKMGVSLDGAKFASADLITKLRMLQTATGGNKAEMLKLTGGAAGFQAAMMLLNNKGQQFTKILGDMKTSSGMTASAFAVHEQTMAAQWDHLKVSGENALIKLGQALEPLVQAITSKVIPALSQFSTWMSTHGAAARAIFLGIAGAVGALGTAFLAFGPGGELVKNLLKDSKGAGEGVAKVFGGLRGTFGNLADMGGKAGKTLGDTLVKGMANLRNIGPLTSQALDTMAGKLQFLAGNPLPHIVDGLSKMRGAFTSIPGVLKGAWTAFQDGGGILGLLKTGMSGLWSTIAEGLPALLSLGGTLLAVIGPVLLIAGAIALGVIIFTKFHAQLMQVVGYLATQLKPQFDDMRKTVTTALHTIQAQWNAVWPKLKPAITDLINALKNLAPVFQIVFSVIGLVLKAVLGIIVGVVGGFLAALPAIAGFFAAVFRFIGDFGALIEAVFHGQWGKIPGILLDMLGQIGLIVRNGLSAVATFISNTLLDIVDWFNKMTGGALTPIENFIKGAIAWFTHLWDELVGHSIVPDMVNGIVRWIASLPGKALAYVRLLVNEVIAFFDQMTGGAVSKALSLVRQVEDAIGQLPAKALTWGADMVANLASGITGAMGHITSAVGGIANAISSHLHFSLPEKGPLANADRWMPDFMQIITRGLQTQASTVAAAARGVGGQIAGGLHAGMANATGAAGGMAGMPGAGLSAAVAPVTAGGLYGGGAGISGGGLGGLGGLGGNSAIVALLSQLVQAQSRQAPLGAAPTPANLGGITQNLGGVSINGVSDINALYQQLNMLAGLAIEHGARGATAGLGL